MPRLALGLVCLATSLHPALAQDKGAASAFLPGAADFAQTLPLTARGNEPGWVMTITGDGVALSEQSGEAAQSPLPAALADGDDLLLSLQGGEVVRLSPVLCRDSMTGMPYPLSVTVERAADALTGCGGDPAALLQGEWTLAEMVTGPIPAGAEVTLAVQGDRVSGKSACNRYMGGVQIGAEGISFGQLAGTRMACAEPMMKAETAYLGAMAQVTGFDISDQGALVLMAGDGPILTFRK